MWLQLTVIIFGFIGLLIFDNNYQISTKKQRQYYVVYICLLLILQSGLRNVAVGADTFEYYNQFKYYSSLTWRQILDEYILGTINGTTKEGGFGLLNKTINLFTNNFQIYLFVIAIFFFTCLGKFIYHNTRTLYDVFMSLCFYELFFYTFFSITGIRQTIAVGITLLAYKYIKQRNLIKFIIFILIASAFHKTSLIFIPFYYIYLIKKRNIIIYSLLALPFLFVSARAFAGILANLVDDYTWYAESTYANAGGPNYLIMLLLLTVASYFKFNKIEIIENSKYTPYINALVITLILSPLVWVDPTLLRLSYYYSIFIIALFPRLVDTFFSKNDSKSKSIITILVVCVFSFIIIKTNSPYAFFWQEMELGSNYR